MQPDQLAALDAWIARQREPRPSRPEAIRRLVELGLSVPRGVGKPGPAADRASSATHAKKVAGAAVDRALKGSVETDDVKGQRKRKLTEMPDSFRSRKPSGT